MKVYSANVNQLIQLEYFSVELFGLGSIPNLLLHLLVLILTTIRGMKIQHRFFVMNILTSCLSFIYAVALSH